MLSPSAARRIARAASIISETGLELRIIALYIVKSKDNAYRFINDMIPDGIELFEAVVRIQERVRKTEGLEVDSGPARQTLSNLNARKLGLGMNQSDSHLDMLTLAKEVGLRQEYLDVNKICSKLVHRTAFSVLVFEPEGELGYIGPLMYHFGVQYGLDVWATLTAHIGQYGLHPVP